MSKASAESPVDWATVDLPDAWPDQLNWRHPLTGPRLFLRALRARRARVELPPGMPGAEGISRYILQEFHNLPNGNYSKRISGGYARWFDRVMLGSLREGRQWLATDLAACRHVVDVGCGGGHTAAVVKAHGVPQVTAIDPSPYLLQWAAREYPGVRFQQGLAEDTCLPDASCDGVSVCFVFHEIPPKYLAEALTELRRILVPGGRLALLEPSPVQWRLSLWKVWRQHGWRGVYFKWLSLRAFEPFVDAWHRQDLPALLREHGFEVETDEVGCPFRHVVAVRQTEIT